VQRNQAGAVSYTSLYLSTSATPHLNRLHQFTASMPHANGTIETSYHLQGANWTATVTLPPGIEGQFAWKGKLLPLHSGAQTLSLR
jgi:alpha-L-rhamnosidase